MEFCRYAESTGLKGGGCLELRRTPHPLVLHMATDRDLVPEEVLHSVHLTKRLVVDLSGTAADALREFRLLFASLLKQRQKDEYTLHHYRQGENGVWRAELLTLSRTFWEQGVMPNGVLVLYPVSRLLQTTVKDALATATFSGWLQPIKSEASVAAASTPGLKKRGATTRPAGSKKKPAFFVLRRNLLFCFKSEAKSDKAEFAILLDYYRPSKVEWDTGWVLRLDQRTASLSSLTTVYQLHAATEADIDGWAKTISLSLKEPTEVFGVSLYRMANRNCNRNQLIPDYLEALVDEISKRMGADAERWRCLVAAADAKPPPELTKLVSSAKLPALASHPDMAVAAALRSYLLSLPAPLCKRELREMLSKAMQGDDLGLAASGVLLSPDLIHTSSLRIVVRLLSQAPAAQMAKLSELWTPAVFGAGNETTAVGLLEFLIGNYEQVFVSSAAGSGSGPMSPAADRSLPPTASYATALFKFEARNGKELSVAVGDVVCVFREVAAGWSFASRMSDGMVGAVPSSYLSITGQLPPLTAAASSAPPSVASPREAFMSPRSAETTNEERLLAQFQAFETRAVAALQEERRAKERIAGMLAQLEAR